MNGLRKAWRESASLLLLSKSPAKSPPAFNYDVLVMKRSTASKFMPNAIVFPGGVIERTDCTPKWLDLYSDLGVDDKQLGTLKNSRNKDFIYCRSSAEEIERELSLRITAIRETFEEVGVLLAKSPQDMKRDSSGLYSSALSDFDHRFWQKEVQGNSARFFDLCQTLQVLPDVFSMHAWSNWLTPTSVGKHRFDTIFFVAFLPDRPKLLSMDEKEAQHLLWASPRDLIASHQAETIWLPPPQQYELGKLNQGPKDFDEIAKFSKWRSQFGTTLFFPVQRLTKDGLVHLLPGDDMYPEEPNYFEKSADYEEYKDKNSNELVCRNLHRTVHQNMFQSELIMNIVPQNEHLCPRADLEVKAKL